MIVWQMQHVPDLTKNLSKHVMGKKQKNWQDAYLECQSKLQIGCQTAACAAALCSGLAAACHVGK